MGAADLGGRKILLCVAGGIAAYKVVSVSRSLALEGADVRVLMTPSAHRFVGEQTFASISGNPVTTDLFAGGPDVAHVELARGADIAVVAPATANLLAKMAAGLADDLVSATLLTVTCPVLVAPAMHREMWEHPATRANLETLTTRGVAVVGPSAGPLSSGDFGPGRMAEPDEIVAAATALVVRSADLAGTSVLVTAGGTQEPLDPVRYIGNRSSGRMGIAAARQAQARGAKVTLVLAPTHLEPPPGVEVVRVRTAEEMRAAVVERAADYDVVVKAAAVADFRPGAAAANKIKKASGPPHVVLEPTPDILLELGSNPGLRKPGGVLVGFAAETEIEPGRLAAYAEDKRRSKGADIVVANDVASPDSGFEVATNRAVIASEEGIEDLGLAGKEDVARALFDTVIRVALSPRD